jgi:hypothetical protein
MGISRWVKVALALVAISAAWLSPAPPLARLLSPLSSAHAQGTEVSAVVELIGNPTKARYPDGDWRYARNVWDMEVFDGRLYLGSGNSNNQGPAPNAGPVEVWAYHAETNRFVSEATLDEEQIDQFEIIKGQLTIPNHDPRGDSDLIGFYRLAEGRWQPTRTITKSAHVYDLHLYRGRLFAALGLFGYSGGAVATSGDLGQTWARLDVPTAPLNLYSFHGLRVWQFFEVGDHLLISSLPALEKGPGDQPNTVKTLRIWSTVYRYRQAAQPDQPDQSNQANQGEIEEVRTDFFPAQSAAPPESLRVARPVRVGEATVYIGAQVTTDHQWTPLGLYRVRSSGDDFEVAPLRLPDGALPYDLLVQEGVLYVLLGQPQPESGLTTIAVFATSEADSPTAPTWREVLRFNAPTFARSFAIYHGDFYFGLGSEPMPLSPHTGDLLRVRRDFLTP